ncbi:MAG: hypothetical protein DDT41_01820 [candidate division WS2 bacterium]|nr:hypothetical protein [Candidatus Psychracetigena formicireducens]
MGVDIHNFKVICQFCGKTGLIDFSRPSKETGWVIGWWVEPGWEEPGWKDFEYYLCIHCADEYDEEGKKEER